MWVPGPNLPRFHVLLDSLLKTKFLRIQLSLRLLSPLEQLNRFLTLCNGELRGMSLR